MTILTALGATAEASRISKSAINLLDNRFLGLHSPNSRMPETKSPGALIIAQQKHRNIKPIQEIRSIRVGMKLAFSKSRKVLSAAAERGQTLKLLADFIDSKTSSGMPDGVDIGLASAARTVRAAGQSGNIDADLVAGKLRTHADSGLREIFRYRREVLAKHEDVSELIISKNGQDYLQRCANDCGSKDAARHQRQATAFGTVHAKRLKEYRKTHRTPYRGK